MFVWPGADQGCPLGFPEDQARASGPAFAHTLRRLAYFEQQSPDALSGYARTLITHSMGNLVLEQAMEGDALVLPSALFDTMMVGSSATARAGHQAWLSQVDFSPALYVSENEHDVTLLEASLLVGPRLGQNVDGVTLASNAVYVDFTASSVDHNYFVHSGQDGSHMMAFYDTIMNGLPFDFASAAGIASVEARDGTHVYYFDGQ
jgi:hypothetical protein